MKKKGDLWAMERGYHEDTKQPVSLKQKSPYPYFSYPGSHFWQVFVSVIGKCLWQSLIKSLCLSDHTTHCRKNYWGEGPCSTSNIRWLYCRFFSLSLTSQAFEIFEFLYLLAIGLNTLMSKIAFWPETQKPLTAMSSPASSHFLAVASIIDSPVIGFKCSSTQTSLHTSDNIFAVRSRIALWRSVTKPTFLHERECFRSNLLPQTHSLGSRVSW